MVKNLSFAKINSVYPLYPIIVKVNMYTEESDVNKYLSLVSESKDTPKNMKNGQ